MDNKRGTNEAATTDRRQDYTEAGTAQEGVHRKSRGFILRASSKGAGVERFSGALSFLLAVSLITTLFGGGMFGLSALASEQAGEQQQAEQEQTEQEQTQLPQTEQAPVPADEGTTDEAGDLDANESDIGDSDSPDSVDTDSTPSLTSTPAALLAETSPLPAELLPLDSSTTGAFVVAGGTQDTDYTWASDTLNNVLTIISPTSLTISMADPDTPNITDTIVVSTGSTANITLENVFINVQGDVADREILACAFSVVDTALTLTLVGTNTLNSSYNFDGIGLTGTASLLITAQSNGASLDAVGYWGDGIGAESGSITLAGGTINATSLSNGVYGAGNGISSATGNITITGGTVTATDGAFWGGAGITTRGNITISGGNVTAIARGNDHGCAAIGGASGSPAGNITITGGTVTATVGSRGCAAIGGGTNGSCTGDITITGGTVIATGATTGGAGIGGGISGSYTGKITISGGTVTATSRNANSQDIGNGSTSSTDDNTAASVVIDGGTVWATNGRVAYGSQASTDIKNSNGLTVFANTLTLGSLSTVANTALTSGVVDGIACAATPVAADGVYGIRDVATNASSAVCLWLPATAEGGQGLGTVGLVAASQPSTTGYELAYARDGGETETLVAPVVTSVEPSGTDVPVSGSVVLTFNTAMATSTGTVVLEGGGNTITLAGGSWDTTHTVYTAPFSGLKGLTDYTVEATFASAILGLAVSDTSHSFTTTTALYSASVTPTSKIFDPVVEGYESITPQQFVITNTGTNTLTDIQARLTGADDTSFEISSALAPTTIYPRASATISVHPKESLDARDTPYSATLSLANIAGLSLNIPLSLTVEEPSYVVALDIGSLDFGSLPPGYTHPAYRTLTITNTGNSTITGIGLSLSGSDTSAFAMELERGVSAVEPASSAELLLPASAAVLSPFAAPAAQLATWGDSPSTLTTLADGHTLEPGEQLKVDVAPVSGLAAREAPYTASLDVSSPETTTASSHLSFKVSAPGGGGDGKLPPTADTQAAAALLLGALLAAAGLAALALAFILPPVRYRPALPDNRKLKTAGR